MILSESEKNRIKGMYGLVTESESESAPPPSESVLLMKKNPFNAPKEIYDRLTSLVSYNDGTIRKKREKNVFNRYSKNLQDGDVYVVINEDCLEKKILETIKKGLSGMVGKRFRGSDDNFYIIGDKDRLDSEEISSVSLGMFSSILGVYLPLKVIIPLQDSKSALYYFPQDGFINGRINSYQIQKGYNSRHTSNLVDRETEQKLLNHLNQHLKPLLHRNNLPDDCFEIREIKREQTDF